MSNYMKTIARIYIQLELGTVAHYGNYAQWSAQPALLIIVESVLGTNSYKGGKPTGTPLHWNIRNTSIFKLHLSRQQNRNKTHGKKCPERTSISSLTY